MTSVTSVLGGRHAELLAQLAWLTASTGESQPQLGFGKRAGDFTAMATERIERVVPAERLTEQFAAVERATSKLAEGSYGSCDGCGGSDRIRAVNRLARRGAVPGLQKPPAIGAEMIATENVGHQRKEHCHDRNH